MNKENDTPYFKGRGAQVNTRNSFLKQSYVEEHLEVMDEPLLENSKTNYFFENPRKIINKVDSPDLHGMYSMNPYQGCEHGCIYCYARNTHPYWGFSAGLDFERNIIVKKNAVEVLEKQLSSLSWKPMPIMLSGNTDCYQPAERKLKITRGILEVLLKFRHPVSIITKNSLIVRDVDILTELSKLNLVHVMVSITTLREELRLKMEPRTATAQNRLSVIDFMARNYIPVGVMTAPIIPGLNSSEMPAIIKSASEHGASIAGYTMVRLNGQVGEIFTDWLYKSFPDAAEKVLHQVKECHGGKLNDSRWGTRMKGEGNIAASIRQLFQVAVKQYMKGKTGFDFNLSAFRKPAAETNQLSLF